MQWRFTSKVEDVSDTNLLKAVEAAVKSSLSMKRIKIQGEFIKWTNVATAILKGAAQSTSLMELELETPEEFPPPQEVLVDVRKAKPELRLVVISGGESVLMTSHGITCYSTSTHVVCLMSQVVSEWCEVVCWYKCGVRMNFPSLHRGEFDSLARTDRHTHNVARGNVDWSHTLLFRCERKACGILVGAESDVAYTFFLPLYCYWYI